MMELKRGLRPLLAAGLLANALLMLMLPQTWYERVPGVAASGPLNTHFVRDLGAAYLVAAAGLAWRQRRPASGAALPGAGFLLLHAGVHAWELATGLCGWGRFLRDVPGVQMTAFVALWLAWPERQHA